MFMFWDSISISIALSGTLSSLTQCTFIQPKWFTNGINQPRSVVYLGKVSCKAELRSKVKSKTTTYSCNTWLSLEIPKKTRIRKVTRDQITIDHMSMMVDY